MNGDSLKAIQQELNALVAHQDLRDLLSECRLDAEGSATIIKQIIITPAEILPILAARIEASKARLRALGFVAPAHAGDSARAKLG